MTEPDLNLAEEEFFATLKLISGEEVIAKVCYLPEDDKVILENPLQVESARTRKGNLEIAGFSLKEWVAASFEDMYIINRSHIITCTELDDHIKNFYEVTIQRINAGKGPQSKGSKLSRESGYLGSIMETKKNLESIYKKS
jgi:hypothetical protein|tara:strand:- start:316 stop:738 length:423 start_codon:yes stop_codon:yes gene_type:complete